MRVLGSMSFVQDILQKLNGRAFVLEPYGAEPTGIKRILAWLAIPSLTLLCLYLGFVYALTTPYMIPQFIAPLLILYMMVIWALPDLPGAPVRLMGNLFYAFVIAVLLWPNYLAIVPPGMPWITAIRLIGLPLTLVLLICVSVSPYLRAEMAAVLRSMPGLWKLIGWFVVIQVVSIAYSKSPGDSINAFVDVQVSCTVMFFVACFVALRPGSVELWAAIMWFSAVAISLCGFWEAKLQHVPWAGHIPSFLQVNDPYVQKVLAGVHRLGTDKYRVQGTHSTSLGLSEYLALTTPFVIHYMMGRYRLWVRVLAIFSLPLIFFTIIQTDARLGVVGFFIAVLLYALCWGVIRWRTVKESILGPALVIAYPVIFALFMAATFFVQRLKKMVWGGQNTQFSNDGRHEQVQQGMPKVWSHPWGYGIGQGAVALDYHNEAGVLTIDTYYLLTALDYGILGFLVYYAAILVVIYNCAWWGLEDKPREKEETQLIPIGIALSAFFVIKSIFSQTENHTLQYMMMGMAAALVYRIKRRQGLLGPPKPKLKFPKQAMGPDAGLDVKPRA